MASRFCKEGEPYEGFIDLKGKPGQENSRTYPDWSGRVEMLNDKLLDPIRWTKPRRIFVNSMSDLFHRKVSDEFIMRHFEIAEENPRHQFQFLTKRSGRMMELLHSYAVPRNAWIGVSAEDQRSFSNRVNYLGEIEAKVKFVSIEPMLGFVNVYAAKEAGVKWIILGGESGPNARPVHPKWVEDVMHQCEEYGIAFFFKQWGAWKQVEWDPNSKTRIGGSRRFVDLYGGTSLTGPRVVCVKRSTPKKNGNVLFGKTYEQYPKV